MKNRVAEQWEFIKKYFDKEQVVLDIGCGFGRQAFLLAKNGFIVKGYDTSEEFITIAKKLFESHSLVGEFRSSDILNEELSDENYHQVLLLDVIEHIPPPKRSGFIEKIATIIKANGILILSLPHLKSKLTSQLNNSIRKRVTQYFDWFFNKEEHPFPIPSKNEILRLTENFFILKDLKQTADTDYYVFIRK